MNSLKRTIIQIAVLLVICGLLVWHAVSWHTGGMYNEMFQWLGTGKAYLTVLYNISFMIVIGVVLGMLLVKITGLATDRKLYPKDRTKEKD
jgi:NhaP-type Na+/H+ or K+/H+ antiporter